MRNDTTEPYQLLDADYGHHISPTTHHDTYHPSWFGRMLSWQSGLVDRVALDVMERAFLFGDGIDPRAVPGGIDALQSTYGTAAIAASAEPFFGPPAPLGDCQVTELGKLAGGGRHVQVDFSSTYQTFDDRFCDDFECHLANSTASARLWRHPERSQPTVLCLHCWCGGYLPFEERIFAAKRLYRDGFNVAVITLPFHGSRTPAEALFSGQFFPSPDLRRSTEAFGQAVADVRGLTGWLRRQGLDGPMGLMGISLGGYISALLASLDDTYDFVIPIIAPASFADILWWHGTERRSRQRFIDAGVTRQFLRDVWAVHCPLSYELKIPRQRALIVAGAGDEVVRSAQSLTLWRHWGQPELRWFDGSHLGHFRWLAGSVLAGDRLDFMSGVVDWLADLDFSST